MSLVVPIDIVETALFMTAALGFVLGIVFLAAIVYMVQYSEKRDYKRYFYELPEKDREELIKTADELKTNLEFMARRSNSKYFLRSHNRFTRFLAYMKEKWQGM